MYSAGKRVIIYGLGSFSRSFFSGSSELAENVSFFSDKDPAAAGGETFIGKPFVHAAQLTERRAGEKIVIGSPYYSSDVRRYLRKELMISGEDIMDLSEWVQEEFGKRLEAVKDALADSESRDYFEARRRIAVDGDLESFVKINRKYSEGRRFTSYWLDRRMESSGTLRTVLVTEDYACGANLAILELCGKTVAGYYCADTGRGSFSADEALCPEYGDCTFVITAADPCRRFAALLEQAGVPADRLFFLSGSPLCSGCRRGQYLDFWAPAEDEVFLDCGAYSGESAESFFEWTKGRFGKLYAFEPLSEMAERIRRRYAGDSRVKVVQAAVWKEKAELSFMVQQELSGSCVAGELSRIYESSITVPAVALDDDISGRVTFIKMDIEGSELEALKGARRIISGQKPRLAISIYHKPMDFLLIPEYILSLVPEYNMAIRHYGADALETVLYAWV